MEAMTGRGKDWEANKTVRRKRGRTWALGEGLGYGKDWEKERAGKSQKMALRRARNGMREGLGDGKGWEDKRRKCMEGKKQM